MIRNQISEKIDLVTAIFWKSDDSLAAVPYLSTTEVIELALKLDKQIFTYFLEREVSMSEVNFRDLESIKSLQNRYRENIGISFKVRDEHDLEDRVLTDLQLFFSNFDKNQKSIPTCDCIFFHMVVLDAKIR